MFGSIQMSLTSMTCNCCNEIPPVTHYKITAAQQEDEQETLIQKC